MMYVLYYANVGNFIIIIIYNIMYVLSIMYISLVLCTRLAPSIPSTTSILVGKFVGLDLVHVERAE